MSLKTLILAGFLSVSALTQQVLAQLPDASTRIYTLLRGSELTEDCPMCDRIPIVVPMSGTFRLRFLSQDPLFAYYNIQNISFHAGTNGGPEYWISGNGTYQIGGEVAVVQDVLLDLGIQDSVINTKASCINGDRGVRQSWPTIQVEVLQTNGTAFKLYSLNLVAEPAVQFRAIIPDSRSGNITLEWDSNGKQAQVERAEKVEGPYSPMSSITTNQTFTDVGALTNRAAFYRLRQY